MERGSLAWFGPGAIAGLANLVAEAASPGLRHGVRAPELVRPGGRLASDASDARGARRRVDEVQRRRPSWNGCHDGALWRQGAVNWLRGRVPGSVWPAGCAITWPMTKGGRFSGPGCACSLSESWARSSHSGGRRDWCYRLFLAGWACTSTSSSRCRGWRVRGVERERNNENFGWTYGPSGATRRRRARSRARGAGLLSGCGLRS